MLSSAYMELTLRGVGGWTRTDRLQGRWTGQWGSLQGRSEPSRRVFQRKARLCQGRVVSMVDVTMGRRAGWPDLKDRAC